MDAVSAPGLVPSAKIDGSDLPSPEEIFQPGLVRDVCRRIWGNKADVKIAALLGCTDRAVRDVFADKVAIPPQVLAAIGVALTRRPK